MVCPECSAANPPIAQFCARCGRALVGARSTVGRVAHPAPATPPSGYRPCDEAADLYYRVGSAWGGARLLGTENVGITIFNAGYGLCHVELLVRGLDAAGNTMFQVRQKLAELPRRAETEFEVPSYEMSDAPHDLRVVFVTAEYDT